MRGQAGRDAEPSAAIVDSQSIKTTETKGERGYDSNKRIKRHILVDVMGLLLAAVVHKASIQERAGALTVASARKRPRVQATQADLSRWWLPRSADVRLGDGPAGWLFETVKRSDDTKGFFVLPKRWIVESTFGWLGR